MLIKNISGQTQTGVETGLYQLGAVTVAPDEVIQVQDSVGEYLTSSYSKMYIPVVTVTPGSTSMFMITDPLLNEATSASIVDNYEGVLVTIDTAPSNNQTLQTPTDTSLGKSFTVVNNDTSIDSVNVNGIDLAPGDAVHFIWDLDHRARYVSAGGGGIYNLGNPTTETVGALPSGSNILGLTANEILERILVASHNPTVSIRATPSFGLYEIGYNINNPLIEGRGTLGSGPTGSLTQLELYRGAVGGTVVHTEPNPTPGTWYGNNDAHTVVIIGGTTQQYSVLLNDDQARSATAAGYYSGSFPYYGTSVNITTLTKQSLQAIGSTYFPVDMVAETGGDKYKADFETANINITGVMFYNTVSGNWEWMGGSKANSLTLRTTSAVTHTVQGSVVNYTRYKHNGVDGAALQTRFYTN